MVSLVWYCSLFLQLDPALKTSVTEALGRLESFQVRFKQVTYSEFMDDTVAEGILSVQRPGKMRMVYQKGERIVRIWDGQTAYERDEMADSVERRPQQELRDEPMVRLLLYGSDLDRYFLLDRFKRGELDIFRLRPRDNDDYQIEVTFNADWLPDYLDVVGEDGEGTRFWFEGYDLNPPFTDETFAVPE